MRAPRLDEILRDFRQRLEEVYGPRLAGVILFGSQARGDALPDSDIDVLVILHGPVNPLQEAHRIGRLRGEISLRYGVVISCVYASATDVETSNDPLIQNIRAEGVAL